MIFYNNKKLKEQIEVDYKELENYKNSYSKRISLYNTYLDTMQVFEDGIAERNNLNKEDMENKKQVFQTQINKIDNNLELLTKLLKNIYFCNNEKGAHNHILLASRRRLRGAALGEVRQVPAPGRLAARHIYA